jgi:hypothetical protein
MAIEPASDVGPGENSDALTQKVTLFANASELNEVRFTEWGGRLVRATPRKPESLEINVRPQHRSEDAAFDIRYIVRCSVLSGETETAVLKMSLLLAFSYPSNEPVDDDVISSFMEGEAWFTAYPYIREGIQSLLPRLGIDAITLGAIHPGHPTPPRGHIPVDQ